LTEEVKKEMDCKMALNPDDVDKYADSYANASLHANGKKVYLHMKIIEDL